MVDFAEICRPVIFELKDKKYTYWGKGSSFLIATAKNNYWVTASHVITNMGGSADSLRIFPSDNSKISLPFNEQYTINTGSTDDEEFKDIFMLRINLNGFYSSGDAPLKALNIERGILRAEQLKSNEELFVIGYPAERYLIDYDSTVRLRFE